MLKKNFSGNNSSLILCTFCTSYVFHFKVKISLTLNTCSQPDESPKYVYTCQPSQNTNRLSEAIGTLGQSLQTFWFVKHMMPNLWVEKYAMFRNRATNSTTLQKQLFMQGESGWKKGITNCTFSNGNFHGILFLIDQVIQ